MAAPAQHAAESERLYRIGDVSRLTDTKPFVLRFWETEFPMLQPVKAPKGHRLYRQEDIDLIRVIKRLLYEEGFTIPGARRHLADALASSEGVAALLERTPMHAPQAVSAPERTTQANLLDALPEPRTALREAIEPGAVSADARRTLVAVRQELRAILTLLGAR
jgi:DNA-binding transcriptional MerR regulator